MVSTRYSRVVPALGNTFAKDAKRRSVVVICVLVVVRPVDPAKDLLCGVLVLECRGEFPAFFGHDGAVAEEFVVTMVRIFGFEEVNLVAECDEEFLISLTDVIRFLDPFVQVRDLFSDVRHF